MLARENYRYDIQILRGLAVFAVLLFHTDPSRFPSGYLGVDIFFVISGFLITPLILPILEKKTNKEIRRYLKDFYARRFYRLAPALGLTLSVSALLIFFLSSPAGHILYANQGIATLLLSGNLGAYRYAGDYFHPNANPLTHTWSLSVEEQIYLALPFFLLLISKGTMSSRTRLRINFGVFLLFAIVINIVTFSILQKLHIPRPDEIVFYSPFARFWEFLVGGFISLFVTKQVKTANNHVTFYSKAFGLISIIGLFTIIYFPFHLDNLKATYITVTLTGFAIIYKTANLIPSLPRIILHYLGDRSYSIYLVHMPLIFVSLGPALFPITNNKIIQVYAAALLSILLGSIQYHKIENRFRLSRKAELKTGHKPISIICLFILLPGILFAFLEIGSQYKYWGMDRNPTVPSYATTIDKNCKRLDNPNPPCTYSSQNSSRTVLLIGDSHAGMISQAVIDAARNRGLDTVVWTKGGCNFQLTSRHKDRESTNCVVNNLKIIKWITTNKPDAVIVSQMSGRESEKQAITEAFDRLKQLIPEVIFVAQTPVFPDTTEFFVNKPIILAQKEYKRSFPISEMNQNFRLAGIQYLKIAKAKKLSIIDPTPLICDKYSCNRYSRQGWLYLDDNHLSILGASKLIPTIEELLNVDRKRV